MLRGEVSVEFGSVIASDVSEDWDAAIASFLISRKALNRSPRTIEDYREKLKRFSDFCKKRNETPKNFTKESVCEYLQLRLQEVKPQSVNHELRVIRAFARFLHAESIRDDIPTANIQRFKEPIYYPRTLSDEQVLALVNTIAKHANTFSGLRDLTLVTLLLDTGIRSSEVLNLELGDIDLAQGFIKVIGKGSKERMIPIGESVRYLLNRYLIRRSQIQNAGTKLFITSLGKPMTRFSLRNRLIKWCKLAGIEGVRTSPHTLRFTFVRRWLASGGDSIILQRILGHSSLAMTAYYAKLFSIDLKEAHRRHSPIDSLASFLNIPRKRIT